MRRSRSSCAALSPTRLWLNRGVDHIMEREATTERLRAAATEPHLLLSSQTAPPIAEPEQTANFFVAAYDPFVFSYAMFDIAVVLHTAQVLGLTELLVSPLSLFASPRSLVRRPVSQLRFGDERRAALASVLDSLLREHDTSSRSLAYAAAAERVSCQRLVPFLRGVCLYAAVGHPFAPQVAYVFDMLRTTGCVSPHIFLDGDYAQRQGVLMALLLASAGEFGSAAMLYTALALSRELSEPPEPYALSRQVSRALAVQERRKLDWALKTRGGAGLPLNARRGWTHNG